MEPQLSRRQALRMMEASYLAAAAALIWLALYYLPIGGALFRLALPLPLALLLVRRGSRAGLEGVVVAILLLVVLMGPLRGPLMLFPYGMLSLWLGWCWPWVEFPCWCLCVPIFKLPANELRLRLHVLV